LTYLIAFTIDFNTDIVDGYVSKPLPPAFETHIESAPFYTAITASSLFIIPLTINGIAPS